MNTKKSLILTIAYLLSFPCFILANLSIDIRKINKGEVLNYSATWGGLTIGTATTRIDNQIHKLGSKACYKIDVNGQTNGIARMFYIKNRWTSFIDTATVMTHKTYKSIREGRYELDEIVYFDQKNRKADVRVYSKTSKKYEQKKVYDTPASVRDVVAGFMYVRLMNLSHYKKGDVFTVHGFYEDEAYAIDIIHEGVEIIKTTRGKIRCFKLKPVIPKNNLFNGNNAVDVWISDTKTPTIMQIRAKMFVGNFHIELDN